jgi:hypothetical protein
VFIYPSKRNLIWFTKARIRQVSKTRLCTID